MRGGSVIVSCVCVHATGVAAEVSLKAASAVAAAFSVVKPRATQLSRG
jgi:hypothetical protein